jgi:hypothetical protein
VTLFWTHREGSTEHAGKHGQPYPLHFEDFGIKVDEKGCLGDTVLGHTRLAPLSMLQSTVSQTLPISGTSESRSTKWGGVWVALFWATQGGPH